MTGYRMRLVGRLKLRNSTRKGTVIMLRWHLRLNSKLKFLSWLITTVIIVRLCMSCSSTKSSNSGQKNQSQQPQLSPIKNGNLAYPSTSHPKQSVRPPNPVKITSKTDTYLQRRLCAVRSGQQSYAGIGVINSTLRDSVGQYPGFVVMPDNSVIFERI